ncbi:MAG: response regulator transcription factor [Acidobacteria bacterium]|nr:response regulator transcription factor [Acidobacteriota bacterium]MCZ6505233.1 response regulator transcription factor [Actinomycetota bacterium]MCZ6566780.1 response regulator transcription factor [Actinomycetota bacterium]MCZ6738373.1 response regulator transcription factor [Actinomycetota bacterium]TDI49094.1 MAG: response regulator transcription factor [Acidobacteriota bacterium]
MAGLTRSVLLVEDDDAIADMLRGFFERDGYRFLHALTGEEAIERLRIRPVSAILLDINLPGIDGIETCRKIREFSQTPVIMLTARDTEVDKVLGLEMGADDYVTKPFSPRELMARIKAVLRRSEEPPAKPRLLDIDGYEIDDGKRTVTTPSSVVVEPTAKEFDLLWFLAENAGLAMSRGQILEGVWGYEYFGETRTVDVHIRQLRKKIEGIPIETVWGVGYRLGR